MARLFSRMWRLVTILAALAGAVLVGLCAYYLLSRLASGQLTGFGMVLPELKAFLLAWMRKGGFYIPVCGLAIAAAITVTEMTELREWVVHALAGAFCAILTLIVVLDIQVVTMGHQIAMAVQSVAAATLAGIAYWALAGRSAGRWRV
jgi:hypothetical protein